MTVWRGKKHILGLPISFTWYKLNEDRLLIETGLFNKTYEESYLYRIIDCKCTVNIFQRIFKLGSVTLMSIDPSTPTYVLKNIKSPLKVKELISRMAIEERKKYKVYEVNSLDLSDLNGDGFPDIIS